MDAETVRLQAEAFVAHLNDVQQSFNAQSHVRGLGVQFDVSHLAEQTRHGRNFRSIQAFFSKDKPGVLYREQIVTAVDAIVELIESPYNLGLVLGALQSGKTTTALALQFAGPAVYLVTGQKVFPFYLTTNQNSHEEQLRIELAHFIRYYGGIDIKFDGRSCSLKNYLGEHEIAPAFKISPNLDTYREAVLHGNDHFHDIYKPATLDDLIHKRVRGSAIRELAKSCQKMVKAGFTPLMIVDEPQFGASDRLIQVGGAAKVVDCLLTQIEKEVRNTIGADADRVKAVGLSATPFELHALQRVWTVFQRLGAGYRGFNDFGGRPIDPSVRIRPPETLSLSAAARKFGIPFLSIVNPAAYSRQRSFLGWAKKSGYAKDWRSYQAECVAAIRDLVIALAADGVAKGRISGICLRAMNDNDRTEDLLADLRLPAHAVEIVKFYGNGGHGMTVKQAIAQRQRTDLPYLFLVTSKARMGDQFPSDVDYFIDFAQQSSDLNALLQGLVGRACGYGKNSLVILSDRNSQTLNNYVATKGGYVATPSRHSVVAGGVAQMVQRQQLTIERDPGDPVLEAFFDEIDRQIVLPMVPIGPSMKPRRASRGGRRGPVLAVAEAHNIFNHLESQSFRHKHLSEVVGTPEIVRRGDVISLKDAKGAAVPSSYLTDASGACRFNFRAIEYAGRAGIKGRGRGHRDAVDARLNTGVLEPSIGLRKRDPASGKWVEDPAAAGEWVAVSITWPLRNPCQFGKTVFGSRVSLPGPLCVYDKYMTKAERARRDARV